MGWHYINCLRTDEYQGLESIKSIEEISEEINSSIDEALNKDSNAILKMTRF